MFKPNQSSLKWMATLLITLSLLLWLLNSPYTTTTGKIRALHSQVSSTASISSLLSVYLWKTLLADVPLSQCFAACSGRSRKLEGKRRKRARQSSGCREAWDANPAHASPIWVGRGGSTKPAVEELEPSPALCQGGYVCSQDWYRKYAWKKALPL